MQRITPNLWFETQAEEAVEFYTSIFPNSTIGDVSRYSEAGPGEPGSVMTVSFVLDGQTFIAINGGPHDEFNDAISLQINCDSQEEVDRYWDALISGGGREVQCGWLKDKYGVSWQVIPTGMGEYLGGDPEKANRAMQAMLKMVKIDLNELRAAYNGTS